LEKYSWCLRVRAKRDRSRYPDIPTVSRKLFGWKASNRRRRLFGIVNSYAASHNFKNSRLGALVVTRNSLADFGGGAYSASTSTNIIPVLFVYMKSYFVLI